MAFVDIFKGFVMRDTTEARIDQSGNVRLAEGVEIYVNGKPLPISEANPIRLSGWVKTGEKSGNKYLSLAGSIRVDDVQQAATPRKGRPEPEPERDNWADGGPF